MKYKASFPTSGRPKASRGQGDPSHAPSLIAKTGVTQKPSRTSPSRVGLQTQQKHTPRPVIENATLQQKDTSLSRNDVIQRQEEYFREQSERWAALNTLEGRKRYAGKLISAGFEFDIGVMEEGNPLDGIAHLELFEGELANSPVPFVMETDAGRTLEVATAPFLLETKPDKPWPQDKAVVEAIGESLKIFKNMKSKGTIGAAATKTGKGFGVDWKSTGAKIEPSNLSVSAQPEKARSADLAQVKVVRDDESMANPQINILTDAEHLEIVENKGSSRLLTTTSASPYWEIFNRAIETVMDELKPLTGESYGEPHPQALRYHIASTIVQGAVVVPLQAKLREYQASIARQEDLDEGQTAAFPIVANLTSFIKDYTNVWLKTDLLTYLKGRLAEEQQLLLAKELQAITAKFITDIEGINAKFLLEGMRMDKEDKKSAQALLKLALGNSGESVVAEARRVVTTLVDGLQSGQGRQPQKRPGLFEIDPSLLGARHDTYLLQKNADQVAQKLGYLRGKLHLVEIRANWRDTILAGTTRHKGTSRTSKEIEIKIKQLTSEIMQTAKGRGVSEKMAEEEVSAILQDPSKDLQVAGLVSMLDRLRWGDTRALMAMTVEILSLPLDKFERSLMDQKMTRIMMLGPKKEREQVVEMRKLLVFLKGLTSPSSKAQSHGLGEPPGLL